MNCTSTSILSILQVMSFRVITIIEKHYSMKERVQQFQLSGEQLVRTMEDLLKIPRRHSLIHPCQARGHYTAILEWFTSSCTQLARDPGNYNLPSLQLELVLSTMGEMIEMTRRECLQKSLILQMVQEYLTSTLRGYHNLFANISKELAFQYERNCLRMEREYMTEAKRLQSENDELKKDKEHRWRNMYMLIKDNRIYRKQNKKLLKTLEAEWERNAGLAEQMLLLRNENQKLKIKVGCLEEEGIRIQHYADTKIRLLQLERKIELYPKRCKKALKSELLKIQINQINGLDEKIKFIIKAIEQTGEIVDEFYDEDVVCPNFHYNISTQTQHAHAEDRGVGTMPIRMTAVETMAIPGELAGLIIQQTVALTIKATKIERKEMRQSKNVMFIGQAFGNKVSFSSLKKEEVRSRHYSRSKAQPIDRFSVCESLKITIFQGRISYISTYNTQIFNGNELIQHSDKKVELPPPAPSRKTVPFTAEADAQTEVETPRQILQTRTIIKHSTTKSVINAEAKQQVKKQISKGVKRMQEQVCVCYDPSKQKISKMQDSQNMFGNFMNNQKILEERPSNRLKNEQNEIKFSIRTLGRIQENEKEGDQLKIVQTTSQTALQSEKQKQSFSISTKPQSKQVSGILSPSDFKETRFDYPKKQQSNKSSAKSIRNPPVTPQLKGIKSNRLSKLPSAIPHKRTATEGNEIQSHLYSLSKTKGRPLHRISQDIREIEVEDRLESRWKRGQREMDFAKVIEKIMRGMELRRAELVNSGLSFKQFLISFFKCSFGKELLPSFLQFLINNNDPNDSQLLCQKLLSPRLPQAYINDLLKSFLVILGKCYQMGESPLAAKHPKQLLSFMTSLYMETHQAQLFIQRMQLQNIGTMVGWFNCLEEEVCQQVLQSELYLFLMINLPEIEETIPVGIIEELSYFMQGQYLLKLRLMGKIQLPPKMAPHRLCLFAYREAFISLLQLTTTIQENYFTKMGAYDQQRAVRRLTSNMQIVAQFPWIQRSLQLNLSAKKRLGRPFNRHLLMLTELNILQFRLRSQLPLSIDLKYINLTYEGITKKLTQQQILNESASI